MVFPQVIYTICSVFVAGLTPYVLAQISYFMSRDLSESVMVIEDSLLQHPNYGIAFQLF